MVIHKCDCSDDFCDKKYGSGLRVFNEMKGGQFRCTTCKKEVAIEKKEAKKEVSVTVAQKNESEKEKLKLLQEKKENKSIGKK